MKKKSASKSKDRDKSKNDDTKTHKHSRRRRKSSSSESEDESDVKPEIAEEVKPKRGAAAKKEPENNVSTPRITRHMKRLAAISAGSDEIKEELCEIASPVKTGKLSPFSGSECKGSPSKERKRDSGTPDKHKVKDSEVWKVKSANGAGGELGKLKICRQRSPEPAVEAVPEDNSIESSVVELTETNNVSENTTSKEQATFPVNEEDIANIQLPCDALQTPTAIADIQLPTDDLQTAIAVANIQLPSDDTHTPAAIADIQLPSDDVQTSLAIASIQLPSDDLQTALAIENIQLPSDDIPTAIAVEAIPIPPEDTGADDNAASSEICSNEIEYNEIPEDDLSQICLPADEPKQPPIQPEQPVEPSKEEVNAQESSAVIVQTEEPVTELSEIPEPQEIPKVEEPPQSEEPATTEVSESSPPPPAAAEEETVPLENVPIPEEKSQSSPIAPVESAPTEVAEKPQSSPRVSEPEDNMQNELVLTVEEPLEEASELVEPELPVEAAVEKPATEKESESRLSKSIDEMEEVYDYEHDDTKEEGELSANESASPIHEVFKKYPVSERSRSWGCCTAFMFSRTNLPASEQVLKELNITKRVVSKDEFDTSDPEDLIFVKEIREENIVHEIESENNNTLVEKEEDDVVQVSPRRDDDKEKSKKRSGDSDRRKVHSRDHVNDERSGESRRIVLKDPRPVSSNGSSVLYITNLVRPFTVTQLRELLLRTGKIVEDGFWIDTIKSKCYVQFETEDEAIETRHALHGTRWPTNNPKVLNVQFATQDDLLSAQAVTKESEIPRKTEPLVVENHAERRGIDWNKHFEQYDDRPVRKVKDVREWDIGKPAHPDEMIYAEPDDSRRAKENISDKDKKLRTKDRRRRNENSDDESSMRKQRKTANESGPPPTESKLLDNLFRKTKASPGIYWLPLSDEQIAVKQETRRKHLEELDKQSKQRKDGIAVDGGGDRERRRDRDRRRGGSRR